MGQFTQPETIRTYDAGVIRLNPDGSTSAQVLVKDAAGKVVDQFQVHCNPNSAVVLTDTGVIIAANLPVAARNDRASFIASFGAAIDAAAAAGRFIR